jgi:peptide/nickel transport system substrate-binding protein
MTSLRKPSTGMAAPSSKFGRGPLARSRILGAIGVVAAVVFGANAWSGSGVSNAASTRAQSGGTATFALPAGFNPNYILPIEPASADSVQQFNLFQFLMYRPLYWEGKGASTAIDPNLSLAALPVYSNGGKTVTIHLKSYKWSDGSPVTSRDIEFFMNLLKANKNLYASYVKGLFPDNVASYSSPNATTLVMHLTRSFNHDWFSNDQLNFIQPMPQHVWDKTSANGAVGNADRTASGAKRVYAFLNKQAKSLSTYATDPLWKVVDGPWKMSQFSSTGPVSFVPNTKYSGPAKPHLSKLTELPFTSATAEENVLRTGGVDYGYVNPTDTVVQQTLRSQGYAIAPWLPYQFSYLLLNYNTSDSTTRAELRQLYIRQAMQHLINQPGYIKTFFHGFAVQTNGPVPINSPYADSTDKNALYPFSISAATQLLKSHGWKVQTSGSTCSKAGSGHGKCGAGIPKGAKLSFHLLYYAGYLPVQRSDEVFQSDASRAGIKITLSSEPLDSIFSDAPQCKPTASACKWQMAQYGGWTPFGYPVVAELFSISSSLDSGSYVNSTSTRNLHAALYSNSSTAIKRYEDYLAKQVPVLWEPSPDTQVSAISPKLKGVGVQSPTLAITPELWYLTS